MVDHTQRSLGELYIGQRYSTVYIYISGSCVEFTS